MTEERDRRHPDEHRENDEKEENGPGDPHGPDFTDEFRPEPVEQRESKGQGGIGEGPQVMPKEED